MRFTFLNEVEQIWIKFYEIQISVSIYKILLEHKHAHSFTYCLGLLVCPSGSAE